jgi:hypothetical protein
MKPGDVVYARTVLVEGHMGLLVPESRKTMEGAICVADEVIPAEQVEQWRKFYEAAIEAIGKWEHDTIVDGPTFKEREIHRDDCRRCSIERIYAKER